ncbi:hypothetical protein KS664_003058 [Clostridium perfringens]|nr:hypothetical protein [Clostridium perfringens]
MNDNNKSINKDDELIEFLEEYLRRGYKINGSSDSIDMALYLLQENKSIRLIKKKKRFFGLYSYDDCIEFTRN